MKLDNVNPLPTKDGLEIKKKQDKELTLLANERRIKGLRVYEYNRATGEILEAEYIQNDTYDVLAGVESKLFVRPNCVYVQALNVKNAQKQALKKLSPEYKAKPAQPKRALSGDF